MENYLRELSVYLFGISSDESGIESELIESIFLFYLKHPLILRYNLSENVPKTIGMLESSEFLFVVEREKIIKNILSDWDSIILLLFDFQMDRIESRKLLLGIAIVLFLKWPQLHYTRDHPSITIISSFETNSYSIDILYYTAW